MNSTKPEPIKTVNQYRVLNAIRIAGLISRVELAHLTGQSRATITNITAKLIKENLIYEKEIEGSAARGRNRVLLAINPDAAFVIGVKVSAFRIGCVLTNIMAEMKSSVIMPVRTNERPVEFVADLIEEGIRHCINEARLPLNRISGIGLGIPGFIEGKKGICHWSPLYRKGDIQLRELIQKRLNINTYIENDANTVTLSQLWTGEGKGVDNFIVITLEDGVGMGIVINGELYRGTKGFAGEFGHVIVRPGGAKCRCGKLGCIEAYASNFAIVNAARDAIRMGAWNCNKLDELTYNDVLEAAQNGQPVIRGLFERAGNYLGIGLAGLLQIFNPSKIIITGNGVRAGSLLFDPMQESLANSTNKRIHDVSQIKIHNWKDIDWSLGAACLVLQEIYKSPIK